MNTETAYLTICLGASIVFLARIYSPIRRRLRLRRKPSAAEARLLSLLDELDENDRRRAERDRELAPLTEFFHQWDEACEAAYLAGRHEPTVTWPVYLFPKLTSVMNPITGLFIPITRVSPLDWDLEWIGY